MIEDSQAGSEAANATGIDTIVTFNDYTKNDNFDRAIAVSRKP
jgi:beta-phosphoglucomutase-like phosphatase (HAD superfamily)